MDWRVKTTETEIIPRLIETEIIPRLVAAHRQDSTHGGPLGAKIFPEDVMAFSEIAMQRDAAACLEFVGSIRSRGVSLPEIYLDLIAPAASRLGALWCEDRCDFTLVTVGLWRMQQVLYDLSPEFRTGPEAVSGEQRRIMLSAVPGSQHTMGILMVSEFFHRAGWQVWGEPMATRKDLLEAVSQQWFDVIGISVGSEPQLDNVGELIHALRRASKNPEVRVMLGGPVAISSDYARRCGANAVAADAEQAIAIATRLALDAP
jgi:methanogenic corrinoid protein MtbC1